MAILDALPTDDIATSMGFDCAPERTDYDERALSDTRVLRRTAQIGRTAVPYSLEIPTEINDPKPVLIFNGYLGMEFAYNGLRHSIAQMGKPAITMHPYGVNGFFSHMDPRRLNQPERAMSRAAWGVIRDTQANQDEYPDLEVGQIDASAHSLGLKIAVETAKHKPHAFTSITKVEGVGCEEHDLRTFARRAPRFLRDEIVAALSSGALKFEEGLWHAARSEIGYCLPDLPLTVARGLMAARANCQTDISYLRRRHNIMFAAIVGGKDNLISAEKTLANALGLFDGYRILEDADHLGPITNPEPFAQAIVELTKIMHDNK